MVMKGVFLHYIEIQRKEELMATKLKNLEVTKVDFVDQGANPDAHIKLYKRKDEQEPASEGGGGERGSGILKKLVAFIAKAAGMGEEEIDNAMAEIQKGDSVSFADRFNEAKNRKIADEIWDICFALQSSLCSILNDGDLDSAAAETAMQDSVDEFCTVVKDSIVQWAEGKAASIVRKNEELTEADVDIMKSARDRLTESIEKASAERAGSKEVKGEQDMGMKIDKSKLTPSEAAFLDSIEKRYGVDDGRQEPLEGIQKADTKSKETGKEEEDKDKEKGVKGGGAKTEDGDAVAKALQLLGLGNLQQKEETEDIYKGLHPAVAAELQSFRKFREDSEDKELHDVAKRYAIIGKKEEELFPVLKSLKTLGGTAYNDMITVLDQAVETVEKSGAFGEIGKSGGHYAANHTAVGSVAKSASESKVDTIAKGYMEKDPALGYVQAVAKAWEDNPELMAAYEEEAGF